jgi:hypothetical protein
MAQFFSSRIFMEEFIMPHGISLHIGLNAVDPHGYGGWTGDLGGCEPDARDMQKLAASLDYNTSMLLTKKATSAALLAAMSDAAKKLKSGDSFFLTYSGHGGQSPDLNGDEDDHEDETWCLYDRQILDDELYTMYGKFASGVRIFVLSDSCHSGTVVREAPPAMRAAIRNADDVASILPSAYKDKNVRFRLALPKAVKANNEKYKELFKAVQRKASLLDPQAGVLLISGCQDDQLSADLGTNGLFTVRLLEARKKVGNKASFQDLHKAIYSSMPNDQKPNLMTVGIGGPALPALPAFTI